MEHAHKAATTRVIFGNTLSACSCGARQWSNGDSIEGGMLDTSGWYIATPINANRRAYDLLQSEGYEDGPEPFEPADQFDAGRD